MKKLLLLFPLLFGCAVGNIANSKLVTDRYLFVRNGLSDTLKVQLVSPDSPRMTSLIVAPRDSGCVRYPFRGVRAVLIASTKDDLRTYDKRLEDAPGLDWFLVASDMSPPAIDACA